MTSEVIEDFHKSEEDSDNENDENHDLFLKSIGVELDDEVVQNKNGLRTEPSSDISLFSISQKDASNKGKKVQLHQLMKDIKGSGNANILRKKINRLQRPKQQLNAPLSKPVSERLQRRVEYEKSSLQVGKWDPIVQKHRKSDNIKFPLNQQPLQIKTVDQFLARKSKSMTPLEEQISVLLTGNKCLERPGFELSVVEEKALAAMSLDEARERLNELRKHRALLSYHQAKNRRQHKIKSRKYHRMLHKRKMKELAGKEVEEGEVTAADRMRAEERASLRHRMGSKWAKNRMIMAKHNEKMKFELQEQQKKHRELVEKPVEQEDANDDEMLQDDDVDENCNQMKVSDQLHINLIKQNPWLCNTSTTTDQNMDCNEESSINVVNKTVQESLLSNDLLLEKDGELKLKHWLNKHEVSTETQHKSPIAVAETEVTKKFKEAIMQLNNYDNDTINIQNSSGDIENEIESNENVESCDGLIESQVNLEDDDQPETTIDQKSLSNNKINSMKAPSLLKTKVDSSFTIPSSNTSVQHPQMVENDASSADMEQRMTIEQAFADDDVLTEFKLEKEKCVESSKPKEEDLTLPGWGSWGGAGVNPSKSKKRKVKKTVNAPTRKDHQLGHVILNDTRDVHIAKHQVNQIPFPFVDKDQFECSVARPIGATWNTQETFSSLVKRNVETVKGAIIPPMDSEEIGETKQQQILKSKKLKKHGKTKKHKVLQKKSN